MLKMAKKYRPKGEGAMYQLPNGKWRGRIDIGIDENGKRKTKDVYGNSKREVAEKIQAVKYQIFSGSFVDNSSITVYHLAKQIIDDDYNQGEIKESTYYRNLEIVKRLKSIYNTPLQDCTETQIKAFLLSRSKGYSQSVISKDFGLLKRTFKEAVRRGIINKNPMEYMRCPKSKKANVKTRALAVEEQQRLVTALKTKDIRYNRQMLLSMFTGMRMGEVNALKINDINFNFNSITVRRTISRGDGNALFIADSPKTDAGNRVIRFDEALKAFLLECVSGKKGNDLIFTDNKGGLISTNEVNLSLKRVLEKYDILDETIEGKVTQHSLRHTFATRCIEGGMTANTLQKILGHTDIKITMNTYTDVFAQFELENLEKVSSYMSSQGISINREKEKTAC